MSEYSQDGFDKKLRVIYADKQTNEAKDDVVEDKKEEEAFVEMCRKSDKGTNLISELTMVISIHELQIKLLTSYMRSPIAKLRLLGTEAVAKIRNEPLSENNYY